MFMHERFLVDLAADTKSTCFNSYEYFWVLDCGISGTIVNTFDWI
jgi:hypothetical protein